MTAVNAAACGTECIATFYVPEAEHGMSFFLDKEGYYEIYLPNYEKLIDYFKYQEKVNTPVEDVTSHRVIEQEISKLGQDYRFEEAENPIEVLRNRKSDQTQLARVKGI